MMQGIFRREQVSRTCCSNHKYVTGFCKLSSVQKCVFLAKIIPGAHSPLYAGQVSWPCLVPADSALWGPRWGRGDLEEQQGVSGEGETTDEH